MFTRNIGQILVIAIALTAVCTGVYAQKTVYKWVDEDGVVHFSDAPLDEWNPVETETLTTAKPPPNVTPAQPAAKSPTASETDDENQSKQPEAEIPPLFEKTDITKMTVEDLDLRCEEAREKSYRATPRTPLEKERA